MLQPIEYNSLHGTVDLIDQRLLPECKKVVECRSHEDIAEAIRLMKIRGAPAIGIAAAFGVFLGLKNYNGEESGIPKRLEEVVNLIASTRPTAVNLFWSLERSKQAVLKVFDKAPKGKKLEACIQAAKNEAQEIHEEDINMCRQIGKLGAEFIKSGQSWLTHCNAGALATGGFGTALGVFRAAKEAGKQFTVFVDETRPLLQGARLTAWELIQDGINAILICDNMAGSLMAAGKIQGIILGADRITSQGYVANKIGTYTLAVLANYHKIPFFVAAPISTFDLSIQLGSEIIIEERDHNEIRFLGGTMIAPREVKVFNPAFDVTPPELITAIITNRGVLYPPFADSIQKHISPSHTPRKEN